MKWALPSLGDPELREAFHSSERDVIIRNNRVACILGVIFMPLG